MAARRAMNHECLCGPGSSIGWFYDLQKPIDSFLRHSNILQRSPQHQRPWSHCSSEITLVTLREHAWNPPIKPVIITRSPLQENIERTHAATNRSRRSNPVVHQPSVKRGDAAE